MPNFLPKIYIKIKAFSLRLEQSLMQFPSIFRSIPERLHLSHKILRWTRIGIFTLLSSLFINMAINQYFTLSKNQERLLQVMSERQKLEKEIIAWKSISEKYPDYADVYLKIASLEYRLGNAEAAGTYIDQAFIINPSTRQGRVLGDLIGR